MYYNNTKFHNTGLLKNTSV